MSAWIVSKSHIDALVHALGRREMLPGHPDLVGQMLWEENHRSVNARYGESTLCPPYSFTQPPVDWTPSQLLHHIGCYDYQSCEHGAWEDSLSFKLMEDLSGALEREGGDRDKIDRETTPWGIPQCGYTHGDWQTCADAKCPGAKVDA